MIPALKWKARGDGRYEALASRAVGGKYFIEWVERRYSETFYEWFECRCYDVDYQIKGGGGRGNVNRVYIRTLEDAKALAQLDHDKQLELIRKYGGWDRIPGEAWYQFKNEMMEWQHQRLVAEQAS
jgi:hypothetical protein